jgi:hypothetical protein
MDKRRKLPHTSAKQVEVLCAFLEETPKAKACLVGDAGGKNAPLLSGTAYSDKKQVYREMAKRVNKKCKLAKTLEWTEEVAKNRWEGIYTKYTKAVTMSRTTGEGVDGTRDGQATFEDKLEKACPCFARLDALFGSRQSVRPTSVVMSGAVPRDEEKNDDVDDDDDDDDDAPPIDLTGIGVPDEDDADSAEAVSAGQKRAATKPADAKPADAQNKKAKKTKTDADSKTSESMDSEAVRQLTDRFGNRGSAQKSNTSFAAQYAKAEETRLAMMKEEMDFKKMMETERLKFEQKKYEDEKALERERAKSAVRLELIKAGLRGQELLDEMKMQFPE